MKQKFRFDEKSGTMVPEGFAKQDTAEHIEVANNTPDTVSVIDGNKSGHNIPVSEGVVQFRERSDLTIFQIVDEQTGTPLGYISGYALDINFNMKELRSTERVEQFLGGLQKMFREIILEKAFSSKK